MKRDASDEVQREKSANAFDGIARSFAERAGAGERLSGDLAANGCTPTHSRDPPRSRLHVAEAWQQHGGPDGPVQLGDRAIVVKHADGVTLLGLIRI